MLLILLHLIRGDRKNGRLIEELVDTGEVSAGGGLAKGDGTPRRAASMHLIRIAYHFLEFVRCHTVPGKVLFNLAIPDE